MKIVEINIIMVSTSLHDASAANTNTTDGDSKAEYITKPHNRLV